MQVLSVRDTCKVPLDCLSNKNFALLILHTVEQIWSHRNEILNFPSFNICVSIVEVAIFNQITQKDNCIHYLVSYKFSSLLFFEAKYNWNMHKNHSYERRCYCQRWFWLALCQLFNFISQACWKSGDLIFQKQWKNFVS